MTNQPAENPFSVAERQQSQTAVAQSRAAQQVQASMVVAKRFPRDEEKAIERIRRSCSRKSLAEVAAYAYPRGGTTVTGPSIRLAECIAQNWGNITFGVEEVEQRNGESTVMAFAYDLETNSQSIKTFQVKHERKANKEIKKLDDPRDVYELIANQGARRLRSCILSIIPGDVVDIALDECDRTLKSGNKEPLIDRVRKMASAFGSIGVTVTMLEKRLAHKLDATIEAELVGLRKIYTSISDGAAKREDFFALETILPAQPPAVTVAGDESGGDAAEESAAGLAPAPATSLESRPARRSKAKPVVTPPPPEPTPAATVQPIDISNIDQSDRAYAGLVTMQLTRAMLDQDITEEQVMAFCREVDLAKDSQTELRQLATVRLEEICKRWPDVVKEIIKG